LRVMAERNIGIETAPTDLVFGKDRKNFRVYYWRNQGVDYYPVIDGLSSKNCTLSQWIVQILLSAPEDLSPLTFSELMPRISSRPGFLIESGKRSVKGESLGVPEKEGETEENMPLELQAYLTREGRPAFPVVAQAAFYFGDGLLFFPGLSPQVFDWAVRRSAGEKEGSEILNEEALSAGRALNRGELDAAIFKELGTEQSHSVRAGMPLVVSENILEVPREEIDSVAAEIADGILQAGDLLVVVHGDKKPLLFDRLAGLAQTRGFRVISKRKELLTKEEILRFKESFDGEPILLGNLEEGFFEADLPGQKIALDLKALSEAGMNPLKILALLRQIGDDPEHFGKIGFKFDAGNRRWIVGNEFVAKITALFAAQRQLAIAA